eukprot:987613-Ditylum_brightwellii.AAC.1
MKLMTISIMFWISMRLLPVIKLMDPIREDGESEIVERGHVKWSMAFTPQIILSSFRVAVEAKGTDKSYSLDFGKS